MTTVSPIQRLSQDVISLIAAGEVIDSLAAVVRELSENALDAGATRIVIHLWPEVWRVRVTDNGMGISRADLEQAATAHSTSKIRTCDDLSQIQSLGFRGEALHSLAQLSDLEIRSRVAGAVGWRVNYGVEGTVTDIEEVAIAPGTVVTADALFTRLPNRRQVLPSVAQQLRQVQQTVQQLALCHPQVTWQVAHTDRDWFTLWPGSTAKTILPQILRDVTVHDLANVSLTADDLGCAHGQLNLLVGLPDRCHRGRPDWVRVAINGRTVTAPVLVQSLIYNFRRTLPRDRYPVCFLHLRVPAEQIDWNRNPAKSEIYLQDTDVWCDRIALAVEKTLRLSNLTDSAQTQRTKQLFKAAEVAGSYGPSNHNLPSQLKAVAQVQETYIVAEHSGGLCLVEQHIAHERVIYEQIKSRWQTVEIEPAIILSQLSARQVEQLRRLSLEVDLFGENLWAVRSVPVPLAERDDCADALLELSLGGDVDEAMVATACRTAIRNGTPLTLETMQTLLDDWQRTKNPRTCPHGRPICLTLEESSLSRYFRRHWVIGKSHGLRQ
ncbi:DNA mismatch repair endonuclease MutL [Leptolyngbyaceae cyanobacterium CCMR0082]|uniref:DNA mismatch repair endonuclease MutL n=2 Tax=Adonisia turfae TaxID=2950184 RepID=A0A6M0SGW8_9CYAN|nr:DNA mismatch repair endonuclease MutL [Adonisia turfae CCMR0081]NEZ67745.1 DNA mismatch repair endonuclease MutL [Adonisia turfae CCMR0082]